MHLAAVGNEAIWWVSCIVVSVCVFLINGSEVLSPAAVKTCDVTHYGAVGDGKTNSTLAVIRAIEDCVGNSPSEAGSVVLFPKTHQNCSFVIWPVVVENAVNLTLLIEGNITTLADIDTWPAGAPSLFHFEHCSNILVTGGGGLNGNGLSWWIKRRVDPSHFAPKLITMHHVSFVEVSNLTLQRSPMYHLTFSTANNIHIHDIQIYAPSDSPNTDGMDLGSTTNAHVHDCHIDNGDDNIAVGSGSSNILVEDLTCINGHGTSIGSIGENNSTGYVSNVTFRSTKFIRTQNVARIKTWQGGHGEVSNITYDGLVVEEVTNSILITQYYCPSSQHPSKCQNFSAAVKISNITMNNITGTHVDTHAGILWCSDSIPCAGINLTNINLTRTFDPSGDSFNCWQAHGTAHNVSPKACIGSNAIETNK
eukprot:m.1859 g.1859  ORF g.1859 m.1859 type:complete len:422 (-) comp1651_c0_seq1:155-1420(-)